QTVERAPDGPLSNGGIEVAVIGNHTACARQMDRAGARHLALRVAPAEIAQPATVHVGEALRDEAETRTADLGSQQPFVVHRLREICAEDAKALIAATMYEHRWVTDRHSSVEKCGIAAHQVGLALAFPILQLAVDDIATARLERPHRRGNRSSLVPVVAIEQANDLPARQC